MTLTTTIPSITKNSFTLHTVSAVNLYDIDADPFVLQQTEGHLLSIHAILAYIVSSFQW